MVTIDYHRLTVTSYHRVTNASASWIRKLLIARGSPGEPCPAMAYARGSAFLLGGRRRYHLQHLEADIYADQAQANKEPEMGVHPHDHQHRQQPKPGPTGRVIAPQDRDKGGDQHRRKQISARCGPGCN